MSAPDARYEKPYILRHSPGFMNKFGRGSFQSPLREIDGIPVKTLARQFGTPLFVISEKTLARTYRDIRDAFTHRYPKVVFAWSYKTNYLKAVCAVLHKQGAWAEVVSGMEYEMARKLGVPGDKIIFNGPFKTEESLQRAVQDGARIHIDHFDELHRLSAIAAVQPQKTAVGIRVSLDAGVPLWDKFGFNLESGQAREAARRISSSTSLTLKGLHCHIGTFILDPLAYQRSVIKLLDFAELLRREMNIDIEWIDMGGGFASRNTLHASYLPGEHVSPAMPRYASAVTDPLLARFPSDAERPVLFLEAGRAVVDEAGSLLTTVVATKRLMSGRRALVVDAGVNNLFTALWYKHELSLTDDYASPMEDTTVFGPLCMGIDVVRDSVRLPPLGPGDLLVIRNVGAYNMTQWMQFIYERPAVVLISESGEAEIIRERESLEHVTALEKLPPRLQPF